MASADVDLGFLAGGGSMGERTRAHSWAGTALGEPHRWPQSLRTTVRILLTTGHPTMIFWGPELTCLYNDAFSRSLGPEKHPAILGAPGRRAWAEVWPIVGVQIEQVLRGDGAVWQENQCVPIVRHGELQDVYWTYSYSPIDEPASPHGVGGVLVTCAETTEQVLSERRLASEREHFVQLFDQAPTFLAVLRGPDHVIELANPGYLALTGQRPVVGRKIADALPETATQAISSCWMRCIEPASRTRPLAPGTWFTPHLTRRLMNGMSISSISRSRTATARLPASWCKESMSPHGPRRTARSR